MTSAHVALRLLFLAIALSVATGSFRGLMASAAALMVVRVALLCGI